MSKSDVLFVAKLATFFAFCLGILFVVIYFLGVGGINQLISGINHHNVGDDVWGAVKILLVPTALGIAWMIIAITGAATFVNDW
jgi:hypothetical protein